MGSGTVPMCWKWVREVMTFYFFAVLQLKLGWPFCLAETPLKISRSAIPDYIDLNHMHAKINYQLCNTQGKLLALCCS